MSAYRRLIAGLEQVFFGGMELSALSTPSFVVVLVLQQRYPDASALAGLTAIVVGSVAIAVFPPRPVDTGAWPRRPALTSLPLRFGYFSVLFFVAPCGVAAVAVSVGTLWLTLLGGVVQAIGLAAFPTAYSVVHGDPLQKPTQRV
jgi:hypothetical protein